MPWAQLGGNLSGSPRKESSVVQESSVKKGFSLTRTGDPVTSYKIPVGLEADRVKAREGSDIGRGDLLGKDGPKWSFG